MFQWNARFAIGEELVDNEHAQLFAMLGRIADDIREGNENEQELGVQLREIKAGKSPAEAYEIAENTNFNASIYRPVVEALIHLWTDATDRIGELEKLLEEHDIKAH